MDRLRRSRRVVPSGVALPVDVASSSLWMSRVVDCAALPCEFGQRSSVGKRERAASLGLLAACVIIASALGSTLV